MNDQQLTFLLMLVSLKKELLDLALTIKSEREDKFTRDDIISELMNSVRSCKEIEESCYQD